MILEKLSGVVVQVPDIRQQDNYSCIPAAGMTVAKKFGLGPDTLDEWKKALGTTEARSTSPQRLAEYLAEIGLDIEVREQMTLDMLQVETEAGNAIIVLCRDYMARMPKAAVVEYGHALVVIGISPEFVFAQDPSEDNVTEGSETIAAPGKIIIDRAQFEKNWWDVDADKNKYTRWGITVRGPVKKEEPTVPEKTFDVSVAEWRAIPKHQGYKLAAAAVSQGTSFDDSKLTADAVLSNGTLDRDGEIMIPAGCRLDDYQAGPAPWFFAHQKFPFPIGSAKERALEKDCPVSVLVTPEKITGRCWFNQLTPEAVTVYKLWKLGHLGAVSVGFEGISSEEVRGEEALKLSGGQRQWINRWTDWCMVENSIVGIGANREALAMHASRGHIEKERIPESMVEWFSQFVVKPKKWRSGWERKDAPSAPAPVALALGGFGKGWGRR
jgi:hypothetical protein